MLARELSAHPKVLVAAQPTRGLDVGAIEYMTGRLRAAADDGVGVLLISTELEEILTCPTGSCVIHRGRIVGEMAAHDADLERLGLLMGGRRHDGDAAASAAPTWPCRAVAAPRRRPSDPVALVVAPAVVSATYLGRRRRWRCAALLVVGHRRLGQSTVFSALLDGSLRSPGAWGLTHQHRWRRCCSSPSARSWPAGPGWSTSARRASCCIGAACAAYLAVRLAGPGSGRASSCRSLVAARRRRRCGPASPPVMKHVAQRPRGDHDAAADVHRLPADATTGSPSSWLLGDRDTTRISHINSGEQIPADARLPELARASATRSTRGADHRRRRSPSSIAVVLAAHDGSASASRARAQPAHRPRSGVASRPLAAGALVVPAPSPGSPAACCSPAASPATGCTSGFSANFGWDGLLVALLARNRRLRRRSRWRSCSPPCAPARSFLAATGVDRQIADVVQAMLVLALLLAAGDRSTIRERRRGRAPGGRRRDRQLGVGAAHLATSSRSDALYVVDVPALATLLAFAAIGEWVAERAGTLNISVEGMLLAGAFAAALGSYVSGNAVVGLLVGVRRRAARRARPGAT